MGLIKIARSIRCPQTNTLAPKAATGDVPNQPTAHFIQLRFDGAFHSTAFVHHKHIVFPKDPRADAVPDEMHYGGLVIFPKRRAVLLDGEVLDLTAKEFDLLELFARNPGRAFSRQELLSMVWGYDYEGYSHTVNTHINRLRAKLDDNPSEPRYIKTVWGHGYSFIEPEEAAA
jgi:DNA-binding response OmpR family regulator